MILTPHIGGSTEEAQVAIGREGFRVYHPIFRGWVHHRSCELSQCGITRAQNCHRILNIHSNVPGYWAR